MPVEPPYPRTHLFTVRLWIEPSACSRGELRMRMVHVLSGETHYFRAWQDAKAFLLAKLEGSGTPSQEEGEVDGPDYR